MSNDENVEKFMEEFTKRGIEKCGAEIAEIAKQFHPDALLIMPLYRSCMVIEQSEEQKKKGECTIHSYGDPHWLGKEINVESLSGFHDVYCVVGARDGIFIDLINRSE